MPPKSKRLTVENGEIKGQIIGEEGLTQETIKDAALENLPVPEPEQNINTIPVEKYQEIVNELELTNKNLDDAVKLNQDLSEKLLLATQSIELEQKKNFNLALKMDEQEELIENLQKENGNPYIFVSLLNNRTEFLMSNSLDSLINACKTDVNIRHYELFLANIITTEQPEISEVISSFICKIAEL